MRSTPPVVAPLTLGALLLAALAPAQTPPPPCSTALKGRLVASDLRARTMTVDLSMRRDVIPIGDAVVARLREAKPGDAVTIEMDCRVRPPVAIGLRIDRKPGGGDQPPPTTLAGRGATTVLVSADAACTLTVDFKPAATLPAGGRTELKLAPGEHLLEASTADGRSWKEKVKVGADQIIVEVKLGRPAATPEQYDAQAARACGSLGALRAAGQEMDAILRNRGFKFHKADSAAVSTASASWTRELAALKELVAPSSRARVTEDLSRLDADVRDYADLLVKALEAAQERNTVMGEATTLRAKAQARRELMKLPAETLALAPGCAEAPR